MPFPAVKKLGWAANKVGSEREQEGPSPERRRRELGGGLRERG